jgi:putative zinc finger/helix-turn-helix YgiT family protein
LDSLITHEQREKGGLEMRCPNDHGNMKLRKARKTVVFRDTKFQYLAEHYFCHACQVEIDDAELAASNQRAIADAYRKAVGLLSGPEIVEGRGKLRLSQDELSKALNVGIASIKRWETGQIQTPAMDKLLRHAFKDPVFCGNLYTGNRPLSLSRIKLVLNEFGRVLNRNLFKEGDHLLYSAKYLFFADMLAFMETGQGMTGATYAALPQGPQLNNYRELIRDIRLADEEESPSLTDIEKRIIKRIAMMFPTNTKVYRAAHDEPLWKNKKSGELIEYGEVAGLSTIQ